MDAPPHDQRHLNWPNLRNTRNPGGLPMRHGALTRWRSLARAANLHELEDAGAGASRSHGIRTVHDLRHAAERAGWQVTLGATRIRRFD